MLRRSTTAGFRIDRTSNTTQVLTRHQWIPLCYQLGLYQILIQFYLALRNRPEIVFRRVENPDERKSVKSQKNAGSKKPR